MTETRGRVPLEGTFTRLGGGEGWTFAEVDRLHARERMIAAGVNAAIELSARLPGERFAYSIWRRSEYVTGFPVRAILEALSAAERSGGRWGGAENVGGSPRALGSALTPAEVERIVNEVVSKKR
jgi:hypothetical protein